MAKVTIVAPFPGLGQMAEEVIREQAEWCNRVNVVVGDLTAGLNLASEVVRSGTEVFVSRGGTASLIAAHLDIPVVEINVTALDVLQALRQIDGAGGTVGLVGFQNVCYGFESLGDIFGLPLREIIIADENQVEEKIIAAMREGVRTIVGDAVSVRVAVKLGLEGYLIMSGKEAIFKAVQQAFQIAGVRRKEQERAALLKAVIDGSTDAIVAANAQGLVTLVNAKAEALLGCRSVALTGQPAEKVLPEARFQEIISGAKTPYVDVHTIGAKTMAVQRLPIKIKNETVGAVAIFQHVGQLQSYERLVRQKLHNKGLVARASLDEMIGSSKLLGAVKERAVKCAQTDSTVLITGETGVGKEMLAQSIHNMSRRKSGPFVAVNCAALPETLLESELFGYEEGAFTGARKGGKPGLFEVAHGGTLFLDEIGEMPLSLQARLLRVLQEREVLRLGGDSIIRVDVRVLAATNRELITLVENKLFREDLYYRINVLHLRIPPLRERPEDIAPLARHLLERLKGERGEAAGFTPQALAVLSRYSWPGNVREMTNIIERAVLYANGPLIDEADITEAIGLAAARPDKKASPLSLGDLEQQTIDRVLREEGYQLKRSAERLGISRSTLWRKLKRKGEERNNKQQT